MTERRHDPESLADHLDTLLSGGDHGPAAAADPLVDAAQRLARAPWPAMPADRAAHLEAQIVHAYRQQATAGPTPSPARVWLRWMAAAVVLVLALVAGLTPAVADSLPGDLLYPVKQAVEQVELALAFSPQSTAEVHLTHAERRAEEAVALLARDQFRPELVADALQEITGAADAVQAMGTIPLVVLQTMRERTGRTVSRLDDVVQQAAGTGRPDPPALLAAQTALQQARSQGILLLLPPAVPPPATVTPSPTPTMTARPSASVTPTPSPTPAATVTSSPTPTGTPLETPDVTPTVDGATAGPRAGGQTAAPAATGQTVGGEPDDTTAYDCSSPLPDNAPALGWREHCEDGLSPQDVRPGQEERPGNSGNAPGHSGDRPGRGGR